jgi:epsilon-lactone hydrolase
MPSEAFEAVVSLLEQSDTLDLPIPERRAAVEAGAALAPPPDDVSFDEVDAAGVPSEWVTAPGARSDTALSYLHGGSYTIGSPRTHRRLTAALSRELGCRVLAPDYRLAPEHPFPAAVEDAVAAYRWLLDGGAVPEHLAIAGDSAGGGLTVATVVALRDRGLPLPAAAVAISPWADLELAGRSMTTKADVDPLISRERLKRSADAYLAGLHARSPLASPVYADLKGLPPLLIHVGGRETLLDDAIALAERARSDGVDVTLEIEEEMIHVWHVFAGLFPEADNGVRRVAEFLRAKLG